MLGYLNSEIDEMMYAIQTADLMIDSDENPAIHNYLVMAHEFFEGLIAEGYLDE